MRDGTGLNLRLMVMHLRPRESGQNPKTIHNLMHLLTRQNKLPLTKTFLQANILSENLQVKTQIVQQTEIGVLSAAV